MPAYSAYGIHFALLLGSAVAIYWACEFFVNGVEWAGRKLAVGQKATGTILAAFGTALPESVITLVAVAFGASAASKDLGVGAALGGPLALATIAYASVGVTLILCRRHLPQTTAMQETLQRLGRDQAWFLAVFAAKIGLGVVMFAWKPWLGVAFLVAYAIYVRQEMAAPADEEEDELAPLKFQPGRQNPTSAMVFVQTLAALAVIFVASHVFIGRLEIVGPALGLHPQLLALLFTPIVTELPEVMNAVIWVRQGKYRLALANISGAMMIQATIPTALGLFFTPWHLGAPLLVAAGATVAAIGIMAVAFRWGRATRGLLAGMGLLYLGFAVLVAVFHLG